MKFDLIVSDYDWTLGTAPNNISEKNLQAIKEFRSKGGNFAVVTGRSYSSIKEICSSHGLDVVVGCFQGADIVDLKTEKHLCTGGIESKLALSTINDLLKENIPVVAWANDTLYYRENNFYVEMYLGSEKVSLVKTDDVALEILKQGKVVSKICTVVEEENRKAFVKKYAKKYEGVLSVNSGAKKLVEIINPKYNKGFSVRTIADYYNIPLNKVMTIGDSLNDVDLMNDDWYGVCVGDGDEALKSIAKEVTVPFNEDAVAYLINKYCI